VNSKVALTEVEGRARPVAHFTSRRGWINDAYGVHWDGSLYHMYYQTVPDRTVWSPACAWGHAVSEDLVSWEQRDLALVPKPHETGCWSGCVVYDATGQRRAFYTRVQLDDLEAGSIAMARCDRSGRLASGPGDVVVSGPPGGMPITAFRDPYVWHDSRGWTMIVGAGTADGDGAVLQYRSADLDRWQYAGALCRGRVATGDGVARQVWECPQMIQINDVWVLVVSVQVDGRAGHVAAAVGRYDGTRFTPRAWHRLAFGNAPYATSVFRDRDGRPCAISWLREDPQHEAETSGWAGAQSLVSELAVDDARRVTARPHSGLAGSKMFANHAPLARPWVQDITESTPGLGTHLTVSADTLPEIEVRQARQRLAHVTRSPAHHGLVVDRPGRASDAIPCPNQSGAIDLFIDADILEIFSDGLYGAWRLTSIV
jgi:beta-fructofuranosidase